MRLDSSCFVDANQALAHASSACSGDAVADAVAVAAVDSDAVVDCDVNVVAAAAAAAAAAGVVDAVVDASGASCASVMVVYPLQDRNFRHPVCRSRSSEAGCPVAVAIACTLHRPLDRTHEAPDAA